MRAWKMLVLCTACVEPGHFRAPMSFADPPSAEEYPLFVYLRIEERPSGPTISENHILGPLPRSLDTLGYTTPATAALNALFERLGFVELLGAHVFEAKVPYLEHAPASRSRPRSRPGRLRFAPRYELPWYAADVKVDKMSISMDPQLGDDVRAAAERAGVSVSAWLAAAAAARLRRQALAEFLADWESKHGQITATELAKARASLGYPRRSR